MPKPPSLDDRYSVLKKLFEENRVKTLMDIFTFLPRSILAKDLGTNYNRLSRIIDKHPEDISIKEMVTIAGFIEIDPMIIIKLSYNHYLDIKREREGKAKKHSSGLINWTPYMKRRKY